MRRRDKVKPGDGKVEWGFAMNGLGMAKRFIVTAKT